MNIGEWIEKRAFTHPDREFLKDGERVFSNRAFNERVNRSARALQNLDIVKGERLALIMGNTSEFLEIFFACAKTGAILVPVNYAWRDGDRIHPPRLGPWGSYTREFAEKAAPLKIGPGIATGSATAGSPSGESLWRTDGGEVGRRAKADGGSDAGGPLFIM